MTPLDDARVPTSGEGRAEKKDLEYNPCDQERTGRGY